MTTKYTKAQLEDIVLAQFNNILVQEEHIRLLRENNELLRAYNQKLKNKMMPGKEAKPYFISRRS